MAHYPNGERGRGSHNALGLFPEGSTASCTGTPQPNYLGRNPNSTTHELRPWASYLTSLYLFAIC